MLLLYNEFVVQGHFPFIVFFCSNSLYIGKTCTAFFYSIKHNVSVLKLKSCKVVYNIDKQQIRKEGETEYEEETSCWY